MVVGGTTLAWRDWMRRLDVDGALEGLLPGEQLVEDDAGREDVDAVVPGRSSEACSGATYPSFPISIPSL